MDVMTPEQRKRAMAHNRGRTRPERALASALWRLGFRFLTATGYKLRYGVALPGHPDMIFPRRRVALFVDGCFWHGCPECSGVPYQSGEFWAKKIIGNRERDLKVTRDLEALGWTVLRIPEHCLRTKSRFQDTISKIASILAKRVDSDSQG